MTYQEQFERITLVGGPHHGTEMKWDGGDYVEVVTQPPTTLLSNATKAFRELMVRRHTYRRDPVDGSLFRFVGSDV